MEVHFYGRIKITHFWRCDLENGSSGAAAHRCTADYPSADVPDAAAQLAGHYGSARHYHHAIHRRSYGGPSGCDSIGGGGAGGLHHLAFRGIVLCGGYGLQCADGAAGGRRPFGRGTQHSQAGAGAVLGVQRSHGSAGSSTVRATARNASGRSGYLAGCLRLFFGV